MGPHTPSPDFGDQRWSQTQSHAVLGKPVIIAHTNHYKYTFLEVKAETLTDFLKNKQDHICPCSFLQHYKSTLMIMYTFLFQPSSLLLCKQTKNTGLALSPSTAQLPLLLKVFLWTSCDLAPSSCKPEQLLPPSISTNVTHAVVLPLRPAPWETKTKFQHDSVDFFMGILLLWLPRASSGFFRALEGPLTKVTLHCTCHGTLPPTRPRPLASVR